VAYAPMTSPVAYAPLTSPLSPSARCSPVVARLSGNLFVRLSHNKLEASSEECTLTFFDHINAEGDGKTIVCKTNVDAQHTWKVVSDPKDTTVAEELESYQRSARPMRSSGAFMVADDHEHAREFMAAEDHAVISEDTCYLIDTDEGRKYVCTSDPEELAWHLGIDVKDMVTGAKPDDLDLIECAEEWSHTGTPQWVCKEGKEEVEPKAAAADADEACEIIGETEDDVWFACHDGGVDNDAVDCSEDPQDGMGILPREGDVLCKQAKPKAEAGGRSQGVRMSGPRFRL